jgi:hypothetical protein
LIYYLLACAIGFLINDVKGIAIAILIMGCIDLVKWAINGLMEINKSKGNGE